MKNNFKRYLEYLKDNPKGYWFRARLYGFGWTPATWQGWAVTAVFIGVLLWVGADFGKNPNPSGNEINWFFVKIIVLVTALIAICVIKGEKPKWNWGLPKNNNEQIDTTTGKLDEFNQNKKEAAVENKNKILEFLADKEKVVNNDIEKLLGVSDATVTRYMDELEQEGRVKQVGQGSETYYTKV